MSANFSIAYLIGGEQGRHGAGASGPGRAPGTSPIQKRLAGPRKFDSAEDQPDPLIDDVNVRLEAPDLWQRFHEQRTEMIVTKSGRRMFPTLQLSVTGMNPTSMYSVMVDFVCVDGKRYRYSFHKSRWIVAGPGDAELPCRLHVHADSPASGRHWMSQVVGFDRIKLTNNQMDGNGHVIVNSMHRYRPRIHIILHDSGGNNKRQRTFTFPETEFMAVTAYQNHRITELKIECNPFAKGFRECEMDQLSLLAGSFQAQLLPLEQIYPLLFGRPG